MRFRRIFCFALPAVAAFSVPLLAQTTVPDVHTLRTNPDGYGDTVTVSLCAIGIPAGTPVSYYVSVLQ
ncbi:MAG: hypothetical protein ACREHV_12570 [Rhizomicrobium sp.]